MKTRILSAFVVALLGSVVLSASYFSFEQITVDNTAGGKGLTASKLFPPGQPSVNRVTCRVRTAEISVLWVDPAVTAVTSSVGMLMEPGDFILFTEREQMTNFRAIRTGSTSGQLDCIYMGPT